MSKRKTAAWYKRGAAVDRQAAGLAEALRAVVYLAGHDDRVGPR